MPLDFLGTPSTIPTNYEKLESDVVGKKKLVKFPSGNQYMMDRGAVWRFTPPSADDLTYAQGNLRPVGEVGSVWPYSLNVRTTNVAARLVSITWDSIGANATYHIFRIKDGTHTYAGETTSLTYDVSTTPSTNYRIQVESLGGFGYVDITTPASTILENGPFVYLGDHMSFDTISAGPTEATTNSTDIRNDEPDNMIAVSSLLSSVKDPATPILAIAYNGGGWVVDSNIPAVPSGGGVIAGDSTPTPKLIFTDEKTLPAGVAKGGTLRFQMAIDAGGYISGVNTIAHGNQMDYYTIHRLGQFTRDRQFSGNVAGTDNDSGLAIGPAIPSHLRIRYRKTNNTPSSICTALMFGDSTFRQTSSDHYASVEGIFYFANHWLADNGRKLRFASFGNGGAHSSDILHRALAVAPIIAAPVNGIPSGAVLAYIQIPTANQAFISLADAQQRWQDFLTVQHTLETTTGLIVRPAISTPPASFSQSQANIDGYAYIAEQIVNMGGGGDFQPPIMSESGHTMSALDSSDGAHLTDAGVAKQYPYIISNVLAFAQSIGADV